MVKNGNSEGICHSIHRHRKAYNKCIKDYDKNKEPLYLKYWDVNNLSVQAVSQKIPVSDFK